MLKPYVLRRVSEPGKMIMACPKASGLSVGVSVSLFVFSGSVMLGLWSFLMLHAAMIFMTHKDPHFINARLVFLRCKKTRNYHFIRGNRYDP
jgi:type IV secretory pathway VirB3-like protein